MKHKHFYSHLIESTELTLEIGELNIDKKERVHLLSLYEANIHTIVIKEILDELPSEDKNKFLQNVIGNNHKKTWEHIKEKAKYAEEKIDKKIKEATRDFIAEIKMAKKLNKKSKL